MVTLRIGWRYCVAFYCVIMLSTSVHELVHHVAGRLICGAWGVKSFNYFATACEGTRASWYATYAGPAFSFAMMYLGWRWLLSEDVRRRHLGFATIFAQLPLQRIVMPLFGMNDELAATTALYGAESWTPWVVFGVVSAICLPPLVVAYRSIENRFRWLWFGWYLVLFPYLLWGPAFGLLEYLMVHRGVLDRAVYGIGLLFVLNELATIGLYVATRQWIDPGRGRGTASAGERIDGAGGRVRARIVENQRTKEVER